MQAAQHARADDLRSVNQLEGRCDPQEADGEGNHDRVRRHVLQEQSDELARNAPHDHRHRAHECDSDYPGSPASARYSRFVVAPECQPDADGRGLTEAERDHEGQRGKLKRDGVASNGRRSDPAHEVGGERENAHLQRHRHADRPTEPDHRQGSLRVEPPPVTEQMEAAEAAIEHDHENQRAAHGQPGQGTAQPATDQAKRRQAEVAEDQRPAEQGVERDPGDAQPQDDAGPLERRDEVTQQLEQQPRRGAPHVGAKEGLALPRKVGRLSERAHDVADMP